MKKKILALVFALVIACTTIIVVLTSATAYNGPNNYFFINEDDCIVFVHRYPSGDCVHMVGNPGMMELSCTFDGITYTYDRFTDKVTTSPKSGGR